MMDALPVSVARLRFPTRFKSCSCGWVDSTVLPNRRKPSNGSALQEQEKDNDLHF